MNGVYVYKHVDVVVRYVLHVTTNKNELGNINPVVLVGQFIQSNLYTNNSIIEYTLSTH